MKLNQIKKTKESRPRRILLYGTAGIGKSTWAAMTPNPIFISTEDGLSDIDAVAFPECERADDVYEAIYELTEQDHDFETVVLDSIDWTERLIGQKICDSGGKNSLADFGFGKGFESLAAEVSTLLEMLYRLSRKMHVVLIGHAQIDRFSDPEVGDWDRFKPRLHKKTVDMVTEWCSEVFFVGYRTYTSKEDGGFGKEKTRATGSGERFMRTQERPTFYAKNRLGLPLEVPFDMTECNPFNLTEPTDKEAAEVF